MGYAASGVCFVDADAAAMHACASLLAAGDGAVTACTSSTVAGSTASYTMARTNQLGTDTFAVDVPLQSCEPLTAADALEVGWGLVAVACVALCITLLRKVIR